MIRANLAYYHGFVVIFTFSSTPAKKCLPVVLDDGFIVVEFDALGC